MSKTMLPRFVLVFVMLMSSCGSIFAQSTNSFFQFIQDQSERHYSNVPHEVLASYYVWFGQPGREGWHEINPTNHEMDGFARCPLKGAYSSHDPAVIEWQMDQAKANGITAFAVSWWGRGDWESWEDQAFPILLACAEKKNFKIAMYWEQAPGSGDGQVIRAINELSYVLQHYAKSKAYLKVDGKPVILAYGRVMGQVPPTSWPKIIETTRANCGDFVLVADWYDPVSAALFDGLHTYNLADDPTPNKPDELRDWVKHYYARGNQLARQRGRISCFAVVPGFESVAIHSKVDRRNGERYRVQWQEAIKTQPDWILVTSWNEWGEGTEIEPSYQLGDQYLQITAEYAKPFLNGPTVTVPPPPNNFPQTVPGTTNRLDNLLGGRRIGVLVQDGLNDSEFWAAYCGGKTERLTTSDLIDPKIFNASNFPIFIYMAGEHFVSSVKVTDDLTQSLVRYLHQGGFLMVLPTYGNWPLYYDDSRKGVEDAITDVLDMGIDNGFESPPGDLNFYVNKMALPGLPSPVPYPKTGDIRFRPANRLRASSADYYLPLVQLWDAPMTHFQGDAAVYIEHRMPGLWPGKSIYVWMRTEDAIGPDEFYPSLYEFISTKLKPVR